ncbi:uncharacterized protein AMSG_02412 [Thecamonas trahens ATCC 50062]|uniref:Nucleoporin Nup54 alpha-helical domain-containing protein n=1 Tax=Thecamonas trahens ATCC 50062 TaxID=461836 RepID=A0A0L0DW85_THETB|nr:hypothetical protein AMSG_02412 [Thecamonas trahens ATCC 50062]KNC56442.1 hypothetical protein AMSG_02412 [Thecamonas trahens ATCC 50062]|eukprot:XP_013760954.1 hypothetical protein AMSG_02412 [Thecamonas trahens ATCC 50062]
MPFNFNKGGGGGGGFNFNKGGAGNKAGGGGGFNFGNKGGGAGGAAGGGAAGGGGGFNLNKNKAGGGSGGGGFNFGNKSGAGGASGAKGGFNFGGNKSNAAGASNAGLAGVALAYDPIKAAMDSILAAFSADASNPHCHFQFMFYNVLPEGMVRPMRSSGSGVLAQQAEKNNPDPSRYVPVPARGFADLATRLTAQKDMASAHAKALDSIEAEITAIRSRHRDTLEKLRLCREQHAKLRHDVLCIMKRIEVWRSRGKPITPEEERIRSKLEFLQRELCKPTQFRARLSELEALFQLQENEDAQPEEYNVVDEDGMRKIFMFLKEQSRGLDHLSHILKRDLRDVEIIRRGRFPQQ